MILIRKVIFMEYPEHSEIMINQAAATFESLPVGLDSEGESMRAIEVQKLIRGTKFRRPDGSTIYVGMADQAADVLGLSYRVYENQLLEIEKLRSELYTKTAELNRMKGVFSVIKRGKFFEKLKILFGIDSV